MSLSSKLPSVHDSNQHLVMSNIFTSPRLLKEQHMKRMAGSGAVWVNRTKKNTIESCLANEKLPYGSYDDVVDTILRMALVLWKDNKKYGIRNIMESCDICINIVWTTYWLLALHQRQRFEGRHWSAKLNCWLQWDNGWSWQNGPEHQLLHDQYAHQEIMLAFISFFALISLLIMPTSYIVSNPYNQGRRFLINWDSEGKKIMCIM